MTTTFTPNDTGLAAFTFSRDPDHGNVEGLDLNQPGVPTAGGVMGVLNRGPQIRDLELTWSGITERDWVALEDYVQTVLRGATEPFTLSFGTRTNVLKHSRRLDVEPWVKSGAGVLTHEYPSTIVTPTGTLDATHLEFEATPPASNGAKLKQDITAATVAGLVYGVRCWFYGPAAVSGAILLRYIDDAQTVISVTASLTAGAWTMFEGQATAGSNGANPRFELRRGNSITPDFDVHVWRPQLNVGGLVAYQPVEDTFGWPNVRVVDPKLQRVTRGADVIDVRLRARRIVNPGELPPAQTE